jgi:hypothetical protein
MWRGQTAQAEGVCVDETFYRVYFDDEKAPRLRSFDRMVDAHAWAKQNRPGREYVVVPQTARRFNNNPLTLFRRGID